jgi:hypothetical protein
MGLGGARPGAGRKPKSDELRVQNLARKALISKFGSEEKAFEFLLKSKEPTLIKFVYEHAYGKPREKIDLNNKGSITLKILRGNNPKPETIT